MFDAGVEDPDNPGYPLMVPGIADPANAINPPAKKEIGLPFLLETAPLCPGGVARPCPANSYFPVH